jgi:hypothetical protein
MAHTDSLSWMEQYLNYAMLPFDLFHAFYAHELLFQSREF